MSGRRAVVVTVDDYRTWDRSGGSDLPGAGKAGRRSAEVLTERGFEVELVQNPTGACLRDTFRRLVCRAREERAPAWFVFVGAGATRRDGRRVLCGTDTDRALEEAVLVDDLAWIVANEGPEQIAVTLDCGFTGIVCADRPTRTLTPHAPAGRVRLFRRSDVVLAWPDGRTVPDDVALLDGDTPVGAVLYQISGSLGGDFFDLHEADRDRIGHLRVYPALDPTVPPPFLPDREYWHWKSSSVAWADRFWVRHSDGPPFGPSELSAWVAFDHAAFGSAAEVTADPSGRVYRIVRRPAGVEVGFLELRVADGRVAEQVWYGVPGQIDADGFFLFAPGERLEFTTTEAALAGRTLHVVLTPRRTDTA